MLLDLFSVVTKAVQKDDFFSALLTQIKENILRLLLSLITLHTLLHKLICFQNNFIDIVE